LKIAAVPLPGIFISFTVRARMTAADAHRFNANANEIINNLG
jgi:hypothetical protein